MKGNASYRRPFRKGLSVHVVMRSRLAKGERSFLTPENKRAVSGIIDKAKKRFHVKIWRSINVGNHIHLLIQSHARDDQSNFLRTISALIARHITQTKKGQPGAFERFWDAKPFTKLIAWGRHWSHVCHYLSLNSLEAIGFTKKQARFYTAGFG